MSNFPNTILAHWWRTDLWYCVTLILQIWTGRLGKKGGEWRKHLLKVSSETFDLPLETGNLILQQCNNSLCCVWFPFLLAMCVAKLRHLLQKSWKGFLESFQFLTLCCAQLFEKHPCTCQPLNLHWHTTSSLIINAEKRLFKPRLQQTKMCCKKRLWASSLDVLKYWCFSLSLLLSLCVYLQNYRDQASNCRWRRVEDCEHIVIPPDPFEQSVPAVGAILSNIVGSVPTPHSHFWELVKGAVLASLQLTDQYWSALP